MNKLVPFLFAGGGTVATSVGGFYLLKGNGIGSEDVSSSVSSTTSPVIRKELLFDSVGKFKKEAKNFACVKKYFTNGTTTLDIVTGETNATEISTASPDSGIFFKSDQSGASTPYESCLMVNGKTETYGESKNKWKGTFTGTGTFVRGDEGFINFNISKTSDTEAGNLTFEGIFYLVSKKADGTGTWELKHKKAANSGVKANKSDLDSYFPELGTIKDYTDKPYWGFVDNKDKLDSMCQTSDCTTDPTTNPEVKKGKFIWKKADATDNSKKLKDWCKNLTGWEKLYSNTNFNLEDKIKNFSGEWVVDTSVEG